MSLASLACVKTICCDCAAVRYPSAGIVARRLGRPLTDRTAALVPDAVGCLECGSKRVDVYFAHQNRLIVQAEDVHRCRFCDGPMSKPFLSQFENADFCALCVADGKVSDAEVATATGTLFPGEAYRLMAMQFRDEEAVRLHWLRKAVDEGDTAACSTLGDLLSRSEDPGDLAEAASAYRRAADQKTTDSVVRYAQHRLALMLLNGRGVPVDTDAAVELLYSAADKNASYAVSDLARFIFNEQFGLGPNPRRAFELFCRAHEMNPEGMMDSASVALMLLEGIGVEPDLDKGTEKLRLAVSIYAANKSTFDAAACFEQMMAAISASDGVVLDLPVARTYLDWIVRFGVPGASGLLDRCGGPLPPREPRSELYLSSALPEKVAGHVWWVNSPVRDRIGQPSILGQVERLPNKRWIATTEDGVPIGDTFESDSAAVQALAAAQDCDIPYVDIVTRLRRFHENTA